MSGNLMILFAVTFITSGTAFVSYWFIQTGHPWMAFWLFLLIVGSTGINSRKGDKKEGGAGR